MKGQRDNAVPVEKARKMSPEEMEGKFEIGILVDREAPSYLEEYNKVRQKAKEALSLQLSKEEKEESERREVSDKQ
jgi:2-oxoglutarate ferredoxin oxidoreductase subunit beta